MGRALNRAFELRNRARYRIDFSREEAHSVLKLARALLSLAEEKKKTPSLEEDKTFRRFL